MGEEHFEQDRFDKDHYEPGPAGYEELTADERQYGLIAHLSVFAGLVVPIPFINIIGPIIVWQAKKDESEFVVAHAKEALNFQLTMLLWIVLTVILMFFVVGFCLLPVVIVAEFLFPILGAIAANKGEPYRYPATLRLVT